MYQIYLDDLLFPVAPAKLEIKTGGNNQTVNLISGQEINLLKEKSLAEISFEVLLPQQKYPFARYEGKFRPAKFYLERLAEIQEAQQPVPFVCIRKKPGSGTFFTTDMDVSLEDCKVLEDAENGFDVMVSLSLKEYRHFGTKRLNMTITPEVTVAESQEQREASPPPATYTVVSGDCLWNIAKKILGNGARYPEIYQLNKDQIKNPNLIYPGQVLRLPT